MKATATRSRSYGKFFVGACWSREGWSFGFQVLEVVWGSNRVAFGDVPRLRGNGPDGAGPSDGGKKGGGLTDPFSWERDRNMPWADLIESPLETCPRSFWRGEGLEGRPPACPALRGVLSGVWNGGTAQTELGPPMGGKVMVIIRSESLCGR